MNKNKRMAVGAALAAGASMAIGALAGPAAAWEPTKTVEFIVPAGTGGGADQMARMIQGVVQKHQLMAQPIVVINRSGGAGAEGFLDVKADQGNAHKIIITLSNLFTTPLATGVPFSWEDLTPVAMLALDEFILWVNADDPYQTPQEYLEAAKEAGPGAFKMGGTGSKQEDQIITVALQEASGAEFTYVPFKGGGDVAVQLVGGHINSSNNNPIEQVSHWRAGDTRPLCVYDSERLSYTEKVTDSMAWSDVPTCKEFGHRRRVPDAARHLHAGRRRAGGRRLLHRSVHEGARDARVAGLHEQGRLQHHLHDRRRVQGVVGEHGRGPSGPDGGSGLPRQSVSLLPPGSAPSDPGACSRARHGFRGRENAGHG